MTAGRIMRSVAITAATDAVVTSGGTANITAAALGTYWLDGTGQDGRDLAVELQDALDAIGGTAAPWTVGLDADGHVTLRHSAAGTVSVNFASWEATPEWWGFDSGIAAQNIATGATYTATQLPLLIWYPGAPVSRDSRAHTRYEATVTRTIAGVQYVRDHVSLIHRDLEWRYVAAWKVHADAAYPNEDLATFVDAVRGGQMRWDDDITNPTAGTSYVLARPEDIRGMVGHITQLDVLAPELYAVALHMVQWVSP